MDPYLLDALDQTKGILIALAVAFVSLVTVYLLFADRRPFARRLGDQFGQGQLDAEKRARHYIEE
jgi:hypothetical protein